MDQKQILVQVHKRSSDVPQYSPYLRGPEERELPEGIFLSVQERFQIGAPRLQHKAESLRVGTHEDIQKLYLVECTADYLI